MSIVHISCCRIYLYIISEQNKRKEVKLELSKYLCRVFAIADTLREAAFEHSQEVDFVLSTKAPLPLMF